MEVTLKRYLSLGQHLKMTCEDFLNKVFLTDVRLKMMREDNIKKILIERTAVEVDV